MKEDFKAEELFFMMKKVGLDLTSQMEAELRYENMSGPQIYFMVYLLRHHPQGTYITELCHEIGVSKSTLSMLIKKLRKAGYIIFQENPQDIRKKKLLPTQKLLDESSNFLERAEQMETKICNVLDRTEREELWKLERKLLLHLAGKEQNKERQEVTLQ